MLDNYPLHEKIVQLEATIDELEALSDPLTKAMYGEMSKRHTEMTLQVKEQQAELAKHQGSTFHPDWSLLEATRDTVKELGATIAKLTEQLTQYKKCALTRRVFKLYERITELEDERNLAWGIGYAQGRDDAHTTITQLTAKLKQRDFQDEVLEETGRLLDESQATVDELTRKLHSKDDRIVNQSITIAALKENDDE